ncbi:hypothetical protein [Demequina sp.]|uniref:hypothetical protein n=1 Tax=Demequina sp. TaxID=2050685 RepID=UPI003D13C038
MTAIPYRSVEAAIAFTTRIGDSEELVIWIDSDDLQRSELDQLIRVDTWRSFRAVRLIGSDRGIANVERLLGSAWFANWLLGRKIEIDILPTHYSQRISDGVSDPRLAAVLADGVALAIRHYDALSDARTHAYHFQAPSGLHQNYFVRTGNALMSGAAARLAAYACVEAIACQRPAAQVDEATHSRRIFTDSRTILPVGMLVAQLLNTPGNHRCEVLSATRLDADLFLDDASLVLESVAVSGAFEQRLSRHVEPASTTTVVRLLDAGQIDEYPPNAPLKAVVVCGPERLNLQIQESGWDARDCPRCAAGSPVVRITPEAFSYEVPRADYVSVVRKYAMEDDFQSFVPGALKYSCVSISARPTRETLMRAGERTAVHFDIEGAIAAYVAEDASARNETSLGRRIAEVARQVGEGAYATVVTGPDPASDAIVELARTEYGLPPATTIIAYEQLQMSEKLRGPIAVLLPVVQSGTEAENVSTWLRDRAIDAPIHYLAVVTKPRDHQHLDFLKATLAVDGAGTPHRFDPGFVIPHAATWPLRYHPWRGELEFLSNRAFEGIGDRIAMINNMITSDSRLGHRDHIFLPDSASVSMHGSSAIPLTLQDGFSFWPQNAPAQVACQADVLFAMSYTLERMRRGARFGEGTMPHRCPRCNHNHDGPVSLAAVLHQDYHGSRIDPRVFRRLSDGVVQAALIRSARSVELDYSGSERMSNELADVILDQVAVRSQPEGSALPEFLLALHPEVAHMRLAEPVLPRLVKALRSQVGPSGTLGAWLIGQFPG